MANVYQQAANLAALFGAKSETLRAGARAASVADNTVAGLPNYRGTGGFGGTNTRLRLSGTLRPVDVYGMPSAKLHSRGSRGVETVLIRKSKYAKHIEPDDIRELEAIMQDVLRTAERMSRGPLTLAKLRKMNHPYGRGLYTPSGFRRKGLGSLQRKVLTLRESAGVSNLAVVNKQTGTLMGRWKVKVLLQKTQVKFMLTNTAKHAKYTAFGTRKMKAHGPYTTALAKHLPDLNRAWLKITREAYMRQRAAAMLQAAGRVTT